VGLINWIFDFYQHYRIDQIQKETSQVRVETAALRGTGGNIDASKLEEALGEIALALKTVQRMLVDKGVCSQEELHGMLKRIDLEDGKADGRAPVG
jgi:hypothetical protein